MSKFYDMMNSYLPKFDHKKLIEDTKDLLELARMIQPRCRICRVDLLKCESDEDICNLCLVQDVIREAMEERKNGK